MTLFGESVYYCEFGCFLQLHHRFPSNNGHTLNLLAMASAKVAQKPHLNIMGESQENMYIKHYPEISPPNPKEFYSFAENNEAFYIFCYIFFM